MLKVMGILAAVIVVAQASTPAAAVDELLGTDRAFSAAAARRNVTDALAAMFADDVVMPLPTSDFARSKAKAVEALNANPDNPVSTAEWAPFRGGVSADGQHGFTVGYMTVTRPDQTRIPVKYVAYWVKRPEGWRVAVYKRARSADGPARAMMPPALPARLVPPSADAAAIAAFKASLDRAERAFSDEAQKIGIGPAFAKHGSADAVNVGPASNANFTVGAEAIGRAVGQGQSGPATIAWAPIDVIVASSGDLGVTFGLIKSHAPPPPGQPAAVPFITVWRRASTTDPWKYVAE